MNKIVIVALLAIILSGAGFLAYQLIGGFGTPELPSFNDSHFMVTSVVCPPVFEGEAVIVQAGILDDEPMREVEVEVVKEETVTDSSGNPVVTAVPTTEVKVVGGTGTHTITATLRGGGQDLARARKLSLANNQTETLAFDFGPLPAGSYVVTVTAPSYNNSTMSKAISVYRAPQLDEWTVTGDAAFMLVNLRHDRVDVNIRNDGQHAVIFGGSQYSIYANASDDFGVPLQGLNQTMVQPGTSVTVHATIPAAGRYYLDHFALKVPGRAALVKIPVKSWMSPAV